MSGLLIFMRHFFAVLITFAVLWNLLPAGLASAAFQGAACQGLPEPSWQEVGSQYYAVLYPAAQERYSLALAPLQPEALDAEYARFEALFETSLTLPVTIRLYPTEDHYYCLNAQPAEILEGATHSRVGSREIALIGENILANPSAWLAGYLDILRYEQALLFADKVSAGSAPPGLLVAIGHYAQDPARTIGTLQLVPGGWLEPGYSWRSLWEEPLTAFDLGRKLQATSTVAFLVDTYGWGKFLSFLQRLQTASSYSLALQQTYGLDFAGLQEEWVDYYPRYFESRWRTNVLHNYDLSPYEETLTDGDFPGVIRGLEQVIPFLEKVGQTETLDRARGLLEAAHIGNDADTLVAQSRQALIDGDYQRSLDLVDQARRKYSQISHYYRMEELAVYRDQVQRISLLHQELDSLRREIESDRIGIGLAARVIPLGRSLGRLGDVQGYNQVRELVQMLEAQQRQQRLLLSALGAVLAFSLLGLRIWLLKHQPAPEAHL